MFERNPSLHYKLKKLIFTSEVRCMASLPGLIIRSMRKYILVLAYCLLTTLVVAQNKPYAPSPVPDRIVLSWSEDPARTQSVTWRTDVTVKIAWGEIALADPSPDFALKVDTCYARTDLLVTNNNAAHFHSATFRELEPDQLYAYRVGSEYGWSEWFHFKTAKDTAAPFSFAYFGDAQNSLKSFWSRCVRQAYSTMPEMDFMMHAGDLVNIPNRDQEWGEWFYAAGWITGTKTQMAVPGNHEYVRNKKGKRTLANHWKPTFTFPKNGPSQLSETVYYFDYQGVRFIALNTQAMLSYPEEMVLQKEWLTEVLSTNPNRWTIVTQHHPIYSTAAGRDNPELEKEIQPIFEKYGVDLVLQGHDHTYGRGYNLSFGEKHKDKGPIYVVSVSGPKMYNLNFSEWLTRVASNTQLYQLIHLDGDQLRYEAYTTTGKLYDAFELNKQKDGTNAFVDKAPKEVPERVDISYRYAKGMTDEQMAAYRKRYEAFKKKRAARKD